MALHSGVQNENFYIVCFWVYTILKGYFNFVDHKFLTPGHTYLLELGNSLEYIHYRETIVINSLSQ